ncbi:LptE family protein [uncultured Flavobacterium sp.]|uniref:LptE family protein n=1 Tax=uncultured Flavobacterium sp. TaxID=165435 RepID=UPI0030817374
MKNLKYLLILLIATTFSGCNVYNFTGTGKIDAKTFQVNFFQNNADLVEPGIDRQFTLALQDLIMGQTNLNLVSNGGDLVYEGEIVDYRTTPMTATADPEHPASQNRLTIRVQVRFTNKKKETDDFEKSFEFYYDFPGQGLPTGAILNEALKVIFERITQDIFNESLAKW